MASVEANILNLDSVKFWLIAFLVGCAVVWAVWKMVSSYWAARTIESIPTAKIRSASQGYVELIGQTKMMDGPVIVSPLSGKTCVWFRYMIEEKRTVYTKKGRKTRWVKVKEHISDELFLLEDETGQCVIDPDGADVITENKAIWYKSTVIPSRRYTEWLILPQQTLFAIGLFKSIIHIEQQKVREQVSDLLRQWKVNDPNRLVHLYDTNRDGEVDIHEWQQAREDAERLIRKQNQDFGSLDVMTDAPQHDQPFILSTLPETHLVSRYKQNALLAFLGFIGGGSLLVWAINIRVGM
jgi:hypothetical protein